MSITKELKNINKALTSLSSLTNKFKYALTVNWERVVIIKEVHKTILNFLAHPKLVNNSIKKSGYEELILKIRDSIKKRERKVKERMKEFEEIGKDEKKIFLELCFCLLTANYSAEGGIKIQNKIGERFFYLSEEELKKELKSLGYRFPNKRAEYIIKARESWDEIKEIIRDMNKEKNNKSREEIEKEIREELVKRVKGLGLKESSHFLRNIGCKNLAILDYHVINVLANHNIIEKPKNLNKTKYLLIEKKLKEIAEELGVCLGELDLYIWSIETNKVLK